MHTTATLNWHVHLWYGGVYLRPALLPGLALARMVRLRLILLAALWNVLSSTINWLLVHYGVHMTNLLLVATALICTAPRCLS